MKYNDFHEYEHIIERLKNSPNFKKYLELYNLSEDAPITYAAHLAMQGTTKIRTASMDLKAKERELRKTSSNKTLNPNDHCVYITSLLLKYVFYDVGFFDDALKDYNNQFRDFNRYCKNRDNPYNLNIEQLYTNLLNKNLDVPKETIENYLQVMTLSNKATKILSLLNDYNTKQTVDNAKKINQRNASSGRQNAYSTSKKDYVSAFNELSKLLNEQATPEYSLKSDFLKTYNRYIHKKISLHELKQSQAYIDMNNLFRQNNPNNCYITSEEIFTNLSLNNSISNLYLQKSLYFKKAVREYARLSQTKDANKYKLTKYEDPYIPALSGTTYNITINLAVKGYNAPFSIHESADTISNLENTLGITIEEGNIPRPYSAPVSYKYNSKQKETIADINNIISRRGASQKLTEISNFSQHMLSSLDSLEIDCKTDKKHYRRVSPKNDAPDDYDYI